jgi:hypothetical protein
MASDNAPEVLMEQQETSAELQEDFLVDQRMVASTGLLSLTERVSLVDLVAARPPPMM